MAPKRAGMVASVKSSVSTSGSSSQVTGADTAASGRAIPAAEVYTLLVALLEAPTASWSDRAPTGRASATLEYVTDAGERGSIGITGDRATWSATPGATYRLASPPPPVPES